MILEELKVEGFRSLKSVTWKLGRLNVLIGPNGGGKSNLLSALDLLRIALAEGELKKAVYRMGGMGALVWDGQASEIRVALRTDSKVRAALTMRRLGASGGFEEEFEGEFLHLHAAHGKFGAAPPALESAARKAENAQELSRFLQSWSIHRDVRTDLNSELRRTSVSRQERRVESDGQNLIAVLHSLYLGDRGFEEFLDKAMSAAFPNDYDKLIFPPEANGRVELRVRRKHRKYDDSSGDLSEGTLRFLLLMTILGGPDLAPLIAIDEPEMGLHPRMMSIVAEVAANAAVKSQIILTTHSPEMLDAFSDEVPTTTVVTSNGSETELKTIGGEELKRWIDNYSFGKFAFSGEAEAVL